MSVPFADAATVVVYSRAGCHLCEAAERTIEQVCADEGVTWTRVDIDTDPELQRRFTDQVPVTFVWGAQHDFWQVDPIRLAAALSRGV